MIMKWLGLSPLLLMTATCWAGQPQHPRPEAEYYVVRYAQHYGVPVDFVRAVVEQESGWHECAVSSKGAVGLMQLMPDTAKRLGVGNRCDLKQNISGGVRHLAWLSAKFHGDLRLVAAAYYAGERAIEIRGLSYANPDVVHYVSQVRERVDRQNKLRSTKTQRAPGRKTR